MIKKIRQKFNNHQFSLVIYKLLHDILLSLIIFFLAGLLLETALPTMVSQNNGFLIVIFLIFATVAGISTLGRKLDSVFTKKNRHHLMPLILIFFFLIIGTSLLKFALWQNIIITTLSVTFFLVFYHLIFLDEK